jgi:peptidoglycan/xylan/chitin deacetylase (PgdA/CDA1 family)
MLGSAPSAANLPARSLDVALLTETVGPTLPSDPVSFVPAGSEKPDWPESTGAPSGPDSTDVPTPVVHPDCDRPRGSLATVPVVYHGSRGAKVVALTFDDGWDAENTERILSILTRSHTNATFFPIGRAMLRAPETWKKVEAAGYPIGNHTYDHQRLTGQCYLDQLVEISRQVEVCRTLLGADPMPLLRPPFGAQDLNTQFAASSAGELDVVDWDVDTRDWTGLSARSIARRALAGRNGSIVLMHTFVSNTATALPRIIAGYRARGFQFVTVGELLGIPGPVPFPDAPVPKG